MWNRSVLMICLVLSMSACAGNSKNEQPITSNPMPMSVVEKPGMGTVTTAPVSVHQSSAADVVPGSVSTDALVKAPANTVTPKDANETLRLMQYLDAAGCDFATVEIADNTERKGSSIISVGCK